MALRKTPREKTLTRALTLVCVRTLALAASLIATISTALAATITQVSSSTPNGSYKAGDIIQIEVVFSTAVAVTGVPKLTLETGTSDAVVSFSGGSGTSRLLFSYTVLSGHTSSRLDYQSQNSLSLSGGTIKSVDDQSNATLTLPMPGSSGSLGASSNIAIDTTAPSVSLTLLTANPTNTLPIQVQISFSEAVIGFDTSDIVITNGSVTALTGSGATYTATITASAQGSVGIRVAASGASDATGNPNTASTTTTVQYDLQTPLVTGVTSSPASGAFRATQAVSVVVSFSETVIVNLAGGTPSIELTTGGTNATATYVSGSNSSQLTFLYTIAPGHTSEDLDYTSANALSLNGATIRDLAGNLAVVTLPANGAANSLAVNSNVVIDTTLPTVSISSTLSGDTSLDIIPVTIVFSENVTGFTLSDLAINNGCPTNLRGSGTTYYADIVPRTNGPVSVTVPSGVAADRAGNGNVAAPTPVDINFITYAPRVTNVTSSTPNGSYRAGQTVSIDVSFSEPVSVSGSPLLQLAVGSTATASYVSGSGTNTLTFQYTIASGQNAGDLDYTQLPALLLNGGQIRDSSSQSLDVALTFACPGAAGSLGNAKDIVIDTIAPTIARVSSTTANGWYRAGQILNVQAQFSETIYVTGTPLLTLETGPNDPVLAMISGSGSANLNFNYTIVDGHYSSRLDYQSTSAFNTNGATITDLAGNVAVVTLPTTGSTNSLAGQKQLVVDTIPPTIPNVTSTSTNRSYKAGSIINIRLVLSEIVNVTGSPRIQLNTGIPNRFATYSAGHGTNILDFSYTVGAGDTTEDLDYTSTSALQMNGGAIRDLAGNDSIISLAQPGLANSLSFNRDIKLDTTTPSILSVSSSAQNGTYRAGALIPLTVTLSEPVQVTNTPSLLLNTGPSQAVATYSTGSGTSTLTFLYTVASNENALRLDYASTSALALSNGSLIADPAQNDLNLTLASPGTSGSLGFSSNIIIDTTAPQVVSVTALNADGYYRAGNTIEVLVVFSEPISLTGTATLALASGATPHMATCSDLYSSNTLRCLYTVQAGDTASDLDYTNSSSLVLSSPTSAISDAVGNPALLSLPEPSSTGSLAFAKNITLDTTAPAVTLTSTTSTNTNQSPIPITITFSESVTGLTLQSFSVTNATIQNLAGSGASYSAQLIPTSQGQVSVALAAAAALDIAGNPNLASTTLSRNYDSLRPSVSLSSALPIRSNSSTIPVTVTFSEDVTEFVASDISVQNGTVAAFSGQGSSYSAQIDPTADGDVIISIADNVAIDIANNGNSASATLTRTIDRDSPLVASVTTSLPNGAYPAGTLIELSVVFNEPVQLSGTFSLALDTTNGTSLALCSQITSPTTLSCSYTVQSGDSSADLNYLSTTALAQASQAATITDLANNQAVLTLPALQNPGSLAYLHDITLNTAAPIVTLTSTASTNTNQSPIPLTITFSEDVTGLTLQSFSVTNATIQNLAGSGASYSAQLIPTSQGQVSVTLAAAAALDIAGNPNLTSNTLSRNYDSLRPSVSLSSALPIRSNSSTIPVTVTFSEDVTEFVASDISVQNGTVAAFSGQGSSYSAQIDPAADGDVIISIADNVAIDIASNGNSASATLTRTIDRDSPLVTSVTTSLPNGAYPAGTLIELSVVFNEPVQLSGTFSLALDTTNGTSLALCSQITSPTTLSCSYTVQSGDSSADLNYLSTTALAQASQAATITDLANNQAVLTLPALQNPGSLAYLHDITLDTTAPAVTLTSTASTNTNQSPIPLTITFSESVTGLTLQSFSVTNATIQNLAGSGASYSAQLIPTSQGQVSVTLAAAAALDIAGNPNLASNTLSRNYDSLRPEVRIESNSTQTLNQRELSLAIEFSEEVLGFESSDLKITQGRVTIFSGSGSSYLATILADGDGSMGVAIPANVATDLAGNGNVANDGLNRIVDTTPAKVLLVSSLNENKHYKAGDSILIQVLLSESVTLSGAPLLSLKTGRGEAVANYVRGSGSDTLIFEYQVTSGDNVSELDYVSADALSLAGANITDLALNPLDTRLPAPGTINSLSGTKDIILDTIPPVAPSILAPQQAQVVTLPTVTATGSSENGATIQILDDKDITLCSSVADATGAWSCALTGLKDGSYIIKARATDRAGNPGAAQSLSFTVDTTRPLPPTFTEPVSGATTEARPRFAGTAIPGLLVKVQANGGDLCATTADIRGNWSCVSSSSFTAGRYSISGITQDPDDGIQSLPTILQLTVGSTITGRVLQSSKARAPLAGVTISDGVNSTLTATDGTYSFISIDPQGSQLIASKPGWGFSRATDSSAISDSLTAVTMSANPLSVSWHATPTLNTESFSIWHGGIPGFIPTLRIMNKGGAPQSFTATLYKPDGSVCSSTFASSVSPREYTSVPLRDSECFTATSFGLIKITSPSHEYDGDLLMQRPGGLDPNLTSLFSLPLSNSISGASRVFVDNVYHLQRGDEKPYVMRNELLISNISPSEKRFTVYRFRSSTLLSRTVSISIPAWGSSLVEFPLEQEQSQENGYQEIIPEDPSAPYLAALVRTGEQQLKAQRKTGMFLFMTLARAGSHTDQFARIRYAPNPFAVQYVEVANVSSTQANVRFERIGRSGKLDPVVSILLEPHQTRKIRMNRIRGAKQEAVIQITSDVPNSIIVNSVMKHYRRDKKLLSIKALAIEQTFGDSLFGMYQRGEKTRSVLKLTNAGSAPVTGSITCYEHSNVSEVREYSLRPGDVSRITLDRCFSGDKGVVEVNSSEPGAIVADTLLFRRTESIHLPGRLR